MVHYIRRCCQLLSAWFIFNRMSRTDRLFGLLQALRNLPSPVTAARLGQETGVSTRSIYRDIETLRGVRIGG